VRRKGTANLAVILEDILGVLASWRALEWNANLAVSAILSKAESLRGFRVL
jgi:hypothetical protein